MSSLRRPLEGDVLVHHLGEDEWMIEPELLARHGRTARTLVKEGPLRLTLLAIAAGGNVPAHSAEGPVTIHLLDGDVIINARDKDYPLRVRDVLVIAAGIEHSARSDGGCMLLLTVVHTEPATPK
jgi:quercetin dioxygenase-like cupin family protein